MGISVPCANRYTSQPRGPIAQWLEQGTHNPLVPGSSPGGPTNYISLKFHAGFLALPSPCFIGNLFSIKIPADACTARCGAGYLAAYGLI